MHRTGQERFSLEWMGEISTACYGYRPTFFFYLIRTAGTKTRQDVSFFATLTSASFRASRCPNGEGPSFSSVAQTHRIMR